MPERGEHHPEPERDGQSRNGTGTAPRTSRRTATTPASSSAARWSKSAISARRAAVSRKHRFTASAARRMER